MHNLKSLYGANNRTNLLIYPLAIIETLNVNSQILVIGPRNENDLFALKGLGFKLKNIVGLDLISYSKHIKLGDMHQIPFPNESFDAIICGWTLSYSTDPFLAASEMIRVTRPGGIVGIGVEYSTMGPDDEKKLLGYQIQEFEKIGARVNSTAQILALFKDKVDHVYFNHDAPRGVSHSSSGLVENVSNVAVVFSIKERS
ncbi:methyltransferase domain-containing protein [Hydrogenophaga sp.]|uniref:class I SAM-dependent methyltransferase n=1 Tax=Hydrogenophaga sp. TaxID=1904254 RepID=UPI002636F264|nr:methyltransferase domain-containing protein [Hydrogenophaga sp.]MDM7948214.1 methyltransferase domain-containing protein [Hydrogenophaga sp.]